MPRKFIAIDTETTGPNFGRRGGVGDQPYFVSMCDEDENTHAWHFFVDPFTRRVQVPQKAITEIKSALQGKIPVFHNAGFDIRALESIGISSDFFLSGMVHDTQIASHVLSNRGSHKLKDLANQYLGIKADDESELLKAIAKARRIATKLGWNITRPTHTNENGDEPWMKMDAWLPGQLVGSDTGFGWANLLPTYAIRDAERTIGLWLTFRELLKQNELTDVYLEQLNQIPVVYRMESNGVQIRPKVLKTRLQESEVELVSLQKKASSLAKVPGLNLDSPKQLQEVLFTQMKFPVIRTTVTGASTDKYVIPHLHRYARQHELVKHQNFIETLLRYRQIGTEIKYLRQYQEYQLGGILYPHYNQTGTDTTRFSASRPNIQNVKKREDAVMDGMDEDEEIGTTVRSVFGPARSRIWYSIDYDQLQLRIFAAACGDPSMRRAFEEGMDFHDFMARKVYRLDLKSKVSSDQRRVAKSVNFGFIFGAKQRKVDSLAPGLWNILTQLFPDAFRYMDIVKRDVMRTGKVWTLGDNSYPLDVPPERPYAGVCYIVQGTEGIIVKRAMVQCDSYLYVHTLDSFMSFQVHDELGFDLSAGEFEIDNIIYFLAHEMGQAGLSCGVNTPVSVQKIPVSWDQGIKVRVKNVMELNCAS